MTGFLVVLLTVLGVCAFVGAGLAFERRFGGAIDAWASGAPKPSPKTVPAPRRWTEAQLFEPVSKWVEDAERAVVAADEAEERIAQMGLTLAEAGAPARATCRHCRGVGIMADGLCRPCYMQSRRRLPGLSDDISAFPPSTGLAVRHLVWGTDPG